MGPKKLQSKIFELGLFNLGIFHAILDRISQVALNPNSPLCRKNNIFSVFRGILRDTKVELILPHRWTKIGTLQVIEIVEIPWKNLSLKFDFEPNFQIN